MTVQVKTVLVDQDGVPIPDTDSRFFDVKCERCGHDKYVSRDNKKFLCLGCIDEAREDE